MFLTKVVSAGPIYSTVCDVEGSACECDSWASFVFPKQTLQSL